MANDTVLAPAADMAANNGVRYPNESPEYRRARNALLAQEIELRRHMERVAMQRRALPPGGAVTADYVFDGENGPIPFADLFGEKDTLAIYSYMFGPTRKRPCPMCTSTLSNWEGTVSDLSQRISLAVIARSPIDRLTAFKGERGWRNLTFYCDTAGLYTRDYVSATDEDVPAFNVFSRRDGIIRHFWSAEMGPATADPGQDPRGAPDLNQLWTLLDFTPAGRGSDWYPKLEYA